MAFIVDIDPLSPAFNGPAGQGDDELRVLKGDVKNSYPAIAGPVGATHTELNVMDGILVSTDELNLLVGLTATAEDLNALAGQGGTIDADTVQGRSDVAFTAIDNVFTANQTIGDASAAANINMDASDTGRAAVKLRHAGVIRGEVYSNSDNETLLTAYDTDGVTPKAWVELEPLGRCRVMNDAGAEVRVSADGDVNLFPATNKKAYYGAEAPENELSVVSAERTEVSFPQNVMLSGRLRSESPTVEDRVYFPISMTATLTRLDFYVREGGTATYTVFAKNVQVGQQASPGTGNFSIDVANQELTQGDQLRVEASIGAGNNIDTFITVRFNDTNTYTLS